jgi:cell division inhibitor SepF
MVSARDAYDDWYEDDEPYAEPRARWYEEETPRPLSLVRPPALAFELIAPEDFEAAQHIADRLRAGVPVLIDLQGCDRALTGRLTDFASGLVYALEGSLQYVGSEVLLLTPEPVDVSGDAASAVREPGFYNRI